MFYYRILVWLSGGVRRQMLERQGRLSFYPFLPILPHTRRDVDVRIDDNDICRAHGLDLDMVPVIGIDLGY